MEWRLFADLADAADDREVSVDVGADASVRDALDALLAERPALREKVLDGDGSVYDHVNVLQNGDRVDDLSTGAAPDDELALFPPVTGG